MVALGYYGCDVLCKVFIQGSIRVAGTFLVWRFPEVVFVCQAVVSFGGLGSSQFVRMAEGHRVGCRYQSFVCGRAHNCTENFGVSDF